MRLSLTRAEAKVLLHHFNSLADRGVLKQIRIEGEKRHVLEVRRFIKKLLIAGLKDGTFELPACFVGDPLFKRAAEHARKGRMH